MSLSAFACSICTNQYSRERFAPRNLNCGHTFCAECIDRMKNGGSIQCPICKQQTHFSTTNDLPLNFTACDMASALSQVPQANQQQMSDALQNLLRTLNMGGLPAASTSQPSTNNSTFDIFVKDLNDRSITIEVHQHESIERLKEKIKAKNGIPPNQQRLFFGGKHLDNGQTVSSYGITAGVTIHVLPRMISGGTA